MTQALKGQLAVTGTQTQLVGAQELLGGRLGGRCALLDPVPMTSPDTETGSAPLPFLDIFQLLAMACCLAQFTLKFPRGWL